MLIDTQLHLVDPVNFPFEQDGGGYIPTPEETGDLASLSKVLQENRVDAGVLVQPSGYGTDNSALLDALTKSRVELRGIIMSGQGALDADFPAGVSGVRLNLTDFAGHDVAAAASMGAGVLRRNLILQLQARPQELHHLLKGLPEGPVILDHLGRPDPTDPVEIESILGLSRRADTWLKVSGGFRLTQSWQHPPASLEKLVSAWPSERVIWGSDWPFLNVDGARPHYHDVMAWAASLTDLERASRNAARLFGWADG